jgi:hypothetical protein
MMNARGSVLLTAAGLLAVLSIGPAAAADARSYTAGRYVFELGGQRGGILAGFQGADDPPSQPGYVLGEHMDTKWLRPTPGEFTATLKAGRNMSSAFYEWVRSAIEGRPVTSDASIDITDYDGNVKSTIDLFHATITEVRFPALDAGSANAADLEIHLHAEASHRKHGTGKVEVGTAASQRWFTSGYRLTLGNLDGKGITHVDAVDLRFRSVQRGPALVPVPVLTDANVQFVVQGPAAAQYVKLVEEAFKAANSQHMNARLDYLGERGELLFTLGLADIVFVRVGEPTPRTAGTTGPSISVRFASNHLTFGHPLAAMPH